MSFKGFRSETLDFLFENRMRDSKSWFEEHRADYERLVLSPMRALVEDLTPTMLSIDPELTVDPAVNKTISRIYRDTRFSRDKLLFRSEMWITFMRKKKFWEGLPGFYCLFGPQNFSIGVGYYEASRDSMDVFREMVLKGDKAFRRFRQVFESQQEFALHAESYKRSKYPDQTEAIRKWLDLKNIDFECRSEDLSRIFRPEFAVELGGAFTRLKPEYDFICALEDRRTARGKA